MSQVADWLARETAIDVTRSFSVVAPAGSGKTELLTQRLLALLAIVDNPEEVLAITFTRKAAEEMTERLLSAMHKALQPIIEALPSHEAKTRELAQNVLRRDRERGWQLLQNPNRLRLKTIDGFCTNITQQLPLEARFGADVGVADEPEELYQEATRQLLAELQDNSATADQLATVLALLDNRLESFEQLFCQLLGKRDQWLSWMKRAQHHDGHDAFIAALEANIDTLNCERIGAVAKLLAPLASDICLLLDFASDKVPPHHPLTTLQGITELPAVCSDSLSAWQIIVDQLLTTTNTLRKSVTKANGFPTPKDAPDKAEGDIYARRKAACITLLDMLRDMPGVEEALLRLRELVAPRIDAQQSATISALMAILPRSVAHLWTVFSQRGVVDYIEINRAANDALGDDDAPTDIALKLDYQISHILVDEFQDTSPPQLTLLEKLTAGWQCSDGRTLFIVGDGMQSCYGFREANVGIFLNACEYGIGHVALEPLQLTVNFRSQAGVIDWVNNCFKRAFPARHDASAGAVAFSSAIAQKDLLEGDACQCHAIVEDDDGSAEAAKVVAIIQQIRTDHPKDSVAVLVRGRRHLSHILPALRDADIPWLAQDIDPLGSRSAVRDLLNLFLALNNPGDRNAWAALLRSPLIGLSLADMLELCDSTLTLGELIISGNANELSLSVSGKARLTRAANVLRRAYQQRQRFSPRSQLYRVWCSLHGDALAAAEGASVGDDIERFLACLEQLQASSHGGQPPSKQRIETALKKLYASADTSESGAVSVMTIHKSKGLEFDHVIIPGLDRKTRSQDKALVQWQRMDFNVAGEGFFMAPLYRDKDDEGLYKLLSSEKKRREQLESTRLLYVGVTRAIKRLHLIARLELTAKDEYKTPSENSLLKRIWPTFEEQAQRDQSSRHNGPVDKKDRLELRRMIDPRNRRASLSALPSLPSVPWQPGQGASNIPEVNGDSEAQAVGNLVHRALELADRQSLDLWRDTHALAPRLLVISESLAIPRAMEAKVIQAAASQLALIANDTDHRWIFHSHKARSEWRVIGAEGRLSIIDRVVWDSAGVATIIDFKTASPSNGETVEAFITRESLHYVPQLEHYRQLLSSLGERVGSAGLYFTALGRWQVLL